MMYPHVKTFIETLLALGLLLLLTGCGSSGGGGGVIPSPASLDSPADGIARDIAGVVMEDPDEPFDLLDDPETAVAGAPSFSFDRNSRLPARIPTTVQLVDHSRIPGQSSTFVYRIVPGDHPDLVYLVLPLPAPLDASAVLFTSLKAVWKAPDRRTGMTGLKYRGPRDPRDHRKSGPNHFKAGVPVDLKLVLAGDLVPGEGRLALKLAGGVETLAFAAPVAAPPVRLAEFTVAGLVTAIGSTTRPFSGPLAGVYLTAEGPDLAGNAVARTVVTGEDGRYALTLPGGDYTLAITDNRRVDHYRFAPPAAALSDLRGARQTLDVTARPYPAIYGRVRMADGVTPLPDQLLQIQGIETQDINYGYTDAGGDYRFGDLLDGNYTISFPGVSVTIRVAGSDIRRDLTAPPAPGI